MGTPSLGPTAQQILQILQRHCGKQYTVEDLCELVDSQLTEVQTALVMLNHEGLIERQESPGSSDTYIAL